MADDISGPTDWAARRQRVAEDKQRGYAERVRAGRGDLAPDGAMENDARVYTDPERFQRELETLFREQPILAGLSQDLPEPGSVMLFEELDTSILITRDKSGEVDAFLNMCTHRGAKLAEAPCKRNLLTCPFHGWSFDLNGALVAVPEPEAFENIDKSTRNLVRVPVVEWAGMIFIKPRSGDDAIDIAEHLGSFAPELEQMELANAEPVKEGVLNADCNWKYALDTYGEGYHFPTLHKQTVALISRTETQYENFGNHHRVGWASVDVAEWANKPEEEWPDTQYEGVHYLFPNTVIFMGTVTGSEPFVQIFRHFPDSVGEMHTNFRVYAANGVKDDTHLAEVAAGFDGTAHVVDTEDYWVARNGWARLKSAPPGFKVLYGANELALQNQHRALADATGMPLDIYD
ncbi:MAG: SRPBCC family protein [Pseudomonadota bacterium]